ncbi:MAG: lamin tail domain-containing protein [bacterium]|nr:lamin tail domain-containing protein [bacterium]
MKHTNHRTIVGFLATSLALAPSLCTGLCAQDVVLSEVRVDSTARWIEIHNRSAQPVDISEWSLYYATLTPLMPQNYWWPFPAGTTIAADEFIRVFWFSNPPATVPPGDYYTGTSPYGYLFSLGGEPLNPHAGALALVTTQRAGEMATPSHFVDWVNWGDTGFAREDLAGINGVWNVGTFTPPIPPNYSIARNPGAIGNVPYRVDEWFVDSTPTPKASNIAGAEIESYGIACTVPGHHLVGQPLLRTRSMPLLGNRDFGYRVENTTGFFGEVMLFVYSAAPAPTGWRSIIPPLPGSTCEEVIDPTRILAAFVVETNIMGTEVDLPLNTCSAGIAGLELHSQALVFDWLPNAYPPFQGVSNAVRVKIGL